MKCSRSVFDLISETLADRGTRYVFPSAVAARFWAAAAAERTLSAVDMDRFIAWDDFKAATLAEERRDKTPANGAVRAIFAASILAENARLASSGSPFFTEIIATEHAAFYGAFVSPLSRSFPSLDGVVARADAAGDLIEDPYFNDLRRLKTRYAAFLDAYDLFEPSWDRVPFRVSATRWVLFFPELAEDWDEYRIELERAESVRILGLDELGPPQSSTRFAHFPSAHDEIRWIAKTVRVLLDEGSILPSDIAISIPKIEDYAERLALEFRLLDIPADFRVGKSLDEQPAGRLFSALAACPGTRWSFRALKDLLLDAAFPWKERKTIDALIEFGLRYRCVSGFPENGRDVDVWERSLERLKDRAEETHLPLGSIERFYRRLKRDVMDIVKAPTFTVLREKLLMFKTNNLDNSAIDGEVDKIVARALEELATLAETEKRLAGIPVPNPFDLFRTHLRGVPYVYQSDEPGIRVYDYRVAAGIEPLVHIVANATQDAATVRANPASFLREDRRLRTHVEDRDMSKDFMHAYTISGKKVVFTAGDRGFSAHSVPHRVLSELGIKEEAPLPMADPFQTELDLALGAVVDFSRDPHASPTTVQRRGRELSQEISGSAPPLDLRRSPISDSELAAAIRARLAHSEEEERLSPTDLNEFNACPFSWFLRRGLGIREKQTEIETVDQKELGLLYHRVLERLFGRISEEDARFRAERLEAYKEILNQEIDAELSEASSREGAFQESVYAMLKTRISSALSAYLDADAARLDSCRILGAEFPLKRKYPELGPALSGIADLVLQTNGGAISVVDFKTGLMPAVSSVLPDEDGLLGDLQMASYVRMLERPDAEQVREARFYSIDNREFRSVLSDEPPIRSSSRLPISRDQYDDALNAVDEAMEAIAGAIVGAEYPVPAPGFRSACATCRVSSVCRLPFAGGEP